MWRDLKARRAKGAAQELTQLRDLGFVHWRLPVSIRGGRD
jgi:hypothetical protein